MARDDTKKRRDLLSIGEFAKLTRASIRSLHYYEKMGLLTPAYIDPSSGYRYFEPEQVYQVGYISMCVEEGMPLEELGGYFYDEDLIDARALFSRLSDLSAARMRRAHETLLKMESYRKEFDFQMGMQPLGDELVQVDDWCAAMAEAPVPKGDFSYKDFVAGFTRIMRECRQRDVVTLARQGMMWGDDGEWHTFIQVYDEEGLDERVASMKDVRLRRLSAKTMIRRNVIGPSIEYVFSTAMKMSFHATEAFINEAWVLYMSNRTYALNLMTAGQAARPFR